MWSIDPYFPSNKLDKDVLFLLNIAFVKTLNIKEPS